MTKCAQVLHVLRFPWNSSSECARVEIVIGFFFPNAMNPDITDANHKTLLTTIVIKVNKEFTSHYGEVGLKAHMSTISERKGSQKGK